MLQKFLNLRRTDPTWFWIIVILTLGMIFLIVLLISLLFYILRRKSSGRTQPNLFKITYHRQLNLRSPPENFKHKLYRAKLVELRVKNPKMAWKNIDKNAKKVITRFDKIEHKWALDEARDPNPSLETHIKTWTTRLGLNKRQKKLYERQIKIIQTQRTDLENKMKTMAPPEKSNAYVRVYEQTHALHDLNTIRKWNNDAIFKIEITIAVSKKQQLKWRKMAKTQKE